MIRLFRSAVIQTALKWKLMSFFSAVDVIIDCVSTVSLIQRRFKVGYARRTIIDQTAERGIIKGFEEVNRAKFSIEGTMEEMKMNTDE